MNIARWRDVWRRFAGKGVYPSELAFILDNPLRNLVLPARRLVDRLPLLRRSRVLEIGPGPGYFSREVARRIPAGALILFDIQREMLAKARRKLVRGGHANFHLVQGSAVTLPFAAGAFDLVFLVTVLGEVPDPNACVAEIASVLRPGGVLSITEQAGDPDALTESALLEMGAAEGLCRMAAVRSWGGFTLNLIKTRHRWVSDASAIGKGHKKRVYRK